MTSNARERNKLIRITFDYYRNDQGNMQCKEFEECPWPLHAEPPTCQSKGLSVLWKSCPENYAWRVVLSVRATDCDCTCPPPPPSALSVRLFTKLPAVVMVRVRERWKGNPFPTVTRLGMPTKENRIQFSGKTESISDWKLNFLPPGCIESSCGHIRRKHVWHLKCTETE